MKNRIPSLDGLRALAIVFVLFSHALGTQNFLGRDWIATIGDLGNFGVRIFFVLSGFLITTLLLKEIGKTGTVSLSGFYLRRVFRILPAFYLFLVVVGLLACAGYVKLNDGDMPLAALFLINYRNATERSWSVGHAWSLAVEEQFYLLWPLILRVFGARGVVRASLIAIVAVPFIRMGTYWFRPEALGGIKWEFHTVCDSLATGCALAGLLPRLEEYPAVRKAIQSRWTICLLFAALVMNWYVQGRPRLNFMFGQTVMNLCIAGFLLHAVIATDSIVSKWLNVAWVATLGTMSYSIYLWQQLFMDHHSKSIWCAFPINVVGCVAVGAISFKLVEQPMLRLRDRLQGRVALPSQ